MRIGHGKGREKGGREWGMGFQMHILGVHVCVFGGLRAGWLGGSNLVVGVAK